MMTGLALATVAQARLGETMPELVARFGDSSKLGKGAVFVDGNAREVGKLFTFRHEDWRIDVVMVDGICARIRYAKPEAWTDEQIAAVLQLNAQGHAWKEQPPATERKWIRADGAIATWTKTGLALELPSYEERLRDRKASSGRTTGRR